VPRRNLVTVHSGEKERIGDSSSNSRKSHFIIKDEFLPRTISLSRDAATVYFDDDITKYKEHKLSLSMLWWLTVRAVTDHQFYFQATVALPAEKEPPDPEMVWMILRK